MPQVGVAFAAVMMIGVVLVLAAVALAAVLLRQQLLLLLPARPWVVDAVTRTIQVTVGLILVTSSLERDRRLSLPDAGSFRLDGLRMRIAIST